MTRPSVTERTRAEARRFRFDALVRVLMRRARRADVADVARFRSIPGLATPGAEVVEVSDDPVPRVALGMIGLTGAMGVLPRLYTEVLSGALRQRSRAMHDFLDLLSHRMVAGFAKAGIKYRPHRVADVAALDAEGGADPVAGALLSFTGYGTPGLAPRLAAGELPLLHYAGLFAMRPRSADRLQALVSDWLGRPVVVEQFAGAWLFLPPDQRSRLPQGLRAGAWNRLGQDAAIGVRAYDIQARIVLRVGPLDGAAFAALLPDHRGLKRLVSLVRAYLGHEVGFAVNPVLAAAEVPRLRLDAAADPAPRLGCNSWLCLPDGATRRRDAPDARFEAEIVEAEAERGMR